jgi:tetratricopeptide (TPR) repeat protein
VTTVAALSTRPAVIALLLVLLGVAAYGGRLGGPFVFDDGPAIAENGDIRQLWPLWRSPEESDRASINSRPVVRLSLAINHSLGGAAPWGYHLGNLLIHGINALLVALLLRRTLALPRVGLPAERAALVSLAVSLLWFVHPLNSQVVLYAVQRTESLAALFYLGAILGLTAAASGQRRGALLAVACGWLGMASKEVMVTAPVVALAWDRVLLAASWREIWQRRRGLHAGLAASWLLLAALLWSRPHGDTIGLEEGVGPFIYLLNQAESITTYLKLLAWPAPLVVDYGYARSVVIVDLLPELLLVTGLLATTIWALVRRPVLGLAGLWFFVILAPTSSLVPLVGEVAAERRVYLSALAPITLAVIAASARLARRPRVAAAGLLLVLLGIFAGLTRERAGEFATVEGLWRHTLEDRPDNPRVHTSVGVALADAGRWAEALPHYEDALELSPSFPLAHYNLGNALLQLGRVDSAVHHYRTALERHPTDAEAHANLAAALRQLGQYEEAQGHARRAVELDPRLAVGHTNLAVLLRHLGRVPESLPHFRRAAQLDADNAVTRHNLAAALAAAGDTSGALAEWEAALRLRPDFAAARRAFDELRARRIAP